MAKVLYTIKNAKIYYPAIKRAVLKYQEATNPDNPYENKEYTVDVLMPASELKRMGKKYKKQVKFLKNTKTYDAKEFEARFKVAPPEDDIYLNEDGEYEMIKLKKSAWYKSNGEATPKPRVVGANTEKGVDRKGRDVVSDDVLIGSGSTANVQVSERSYKKPQPGLTLDLYAVQILDLVEVVLNTNTFDDDMGDAVLDDDFEDEGTETSQELGDDLDGEDDDFDEDFD